MKAGPKSKLRSVTREQLRLLSSETIKDLSEKICRHLYRSLFSNSPHATLSFAALANEPDLMPLFEKRVAQQSFCFPRVVGEQLEIRQVANPSQFIPGYADINEPSPQLCPLFPQQDLQIILLPGLAFDPSNGARLGKGKGFYDRLLDELKNSRHSIITIGVCFDCQLNHVPEQAHDQRVNAIVTESGIFEFEKPNPSDPSLISS